METWSIRLPLQRPLNMNARQHWAPKARDVAQLRGDALLLLRSQRIPRHLQVRVELTYYPPMACRTRDADNLVATLKPCCDALVQAGVVADDDPFRMVKMMPTIAEPDGDPRIIFTVIGTQPEPALLGPKRTRH